MSETKVNLERTSDLQKRPDKRRTTLSPQSGEQWGTVQSGTTDCEVLVMSGLAALTAALKAPCDSFAALGWCISDLKICKFSHPRGKDIGWTRLRSYLVKV